MPYIILADKRRELDRRALTGRVVIGRSPRCDLPVRDVLLSRTHCAIDELGGHWVLIDLDSRNGTRVNGEPVRRHVLSDGDLVEAGKTRLRFLDRAFVPAPKEVIAYSRTSRPADPIEALACTVAGFQFQLEDDPELDPEVVATFPRPQPRPHEPRSYSEDRSMQTMLAEIATEPWSPVTRTSLTSRRTRIATARQRVGTAAGEARQSAVLNGRENAAQPVATIASMPAEVKRRILLATCAWGAAGAILWAWLVSLPW